MPTKYLTQTRRIDFSKLKDTWRSGIMRNKTTGNW
jgi:hypothetical protein